MVPRPLKSRWLAALEYRVECDKIAENHVGCQDPGILAIALNALEDFAPTFVEATPTIPAHVVSDCPTCGESPGDEPASGGVRVGTSISLPKHLTWFCFSHGGGFSGIMASLVDHQAVQAESRPDVSGLVNIEKNVFTKSDKDPLSSHQDSQKCTDQRRITYYAPKIRQAKSMQQPCRKCAGCREWRRVHRLSQLKDAVSTWVTVRRTGELSPRQYAALSRRLRRELADTEKRNELDPSVTVTGNYVSVPTSMGRIILTDSNLPVGDVLATSHEGEDYIRDSDIELSVEALVSAMPDKGRISTSVPRKPETEKEEKEAVVWERVGSGKLAGDAEAHVYALHGCPRVLLQEGARGARNVAPRWDLSALSDDERLGLWTGLGIRMWGEA